VTNMLDAQSKVQEKQLHAARVDQRAWISIKGEVAELKPNMPLIGVFTVTNQGKTPAKRIHQTYSIQKLPRNKPPNLTTSAIRTVAFAGVLNPKDILSDTQVQGFRNTSDSSNPLILTKTDLDELNSGQSYLALIASIRYLDIYDVQHSMNYCGWKSYKSGNYEAGECISYNNIDNN
jgi:hypothetical protein